MNSNFFHSRGCLSHSSIYLVDDANLPFDWVITNAYNYAFACEADEMLLCMLILYFTSEKKH